MTASSLTQSRLPPLRPRESAWTRFDLEVAPGEFFAMLGPSGSGKTTCLRLIAGFEQPTSGSIEIFGEQVEGVPPYRRNVNTVFQDYALFPHMNVGENVAFLADAAEGRQGEIASREAEAALEMVKLGGYGERRPGQLSGGQRQRVALARAIVNRPKVLLLDEPLGALDLKLREQMQEELKALQKALGITFIFVTHDQGEALSMADRVAVFNDGRVMQVGTPERDLPPADVARSSPISSARRMCCRPSSSTRSRARSAGRASGPKSIHVVAAGERGVAADRHRDLAELSRGRRRGSRSISTARRSTPWCPRPTIVPGGGRARHASASPRTRCTSWRAASERRGRGSAGAILPNRRGMLGALSRLFLAPAEAARLPHAAAAAAVARHRLSRLAARAAAAELLLRSTSSRGWSIARVHAQDLWRAAAAAEPRHHRPHRARWRRR